MNFRSILTTSTDKEINRYIQRIVNNWPPPRPFVYEVQSSNGYVFYTRDRKQVVATVRLSRQFNKAIVISVRVKYAPKGPLQAIQMAELFPGVN